MYPYDIITYEFREREREKETTVFTFLKICELQV